MSTCPEAYKSECANRWSGEALRNAIANWTTFEEHRADIAAVLEPYLRDCWVKDLSGNLHNPAGTLTGWLWQCSEAIENWWIFDFCEHYQKCHLRRGLITYCKIVIAEIKSAQDPAPGHPEIMLDFETPAWSPAKFVKIDGETMTTEEWQRRRTSNISSSNAKTDSEDCATTSGSEDRAEVIKRITGMVASIEVGEIVRVTQIKGTTCTVERETWRGSNVTLNNCIVGAPLNHLKFIP